MYKKHIDITKKALIKTKLLDYEKKDTIFYDAGWGIYFTI